MTKIGSKRQVINGSAVQTSGGLQAKDLIKIKRRTDSKGRDIFSIVSKKKHNNGKTNKWALAVKEARKQLGLETFVALTKDSQLYKLTKKIHGESDCCCKVI